jgi:LysM domain
MRYRDIRPAVSEADNGAMKRYQYAQQQADIKANTKAYAARAEKKDADSMKNSVLNPDRYTPQQARELGLINDKEYAQRQTQAQALQGVYPELFLTPAGAARGVAGAAAKDVVGGAVKNIAGREVVPAAGNVVKNTVGSEVVPAGSSVTKNVAGRDVVPAGRDVVNTPKLNTIDAPPQLTGPTANTTKQIGRNDPNVIDVTAKDITNRPQLTTNAPRDTRDMFPDAAHDFYYPKKPPPMDLTKPIAAVAAPAIVGAGLYGINQSMQPPSKAATDKDATPAKPPSADQLPKAQGTLPNGTAGQRPTPSSDVIAAQRNAAASTSPAPINTKYQGSAAAQKLAADNNIANPNDIKVGQVINLGGDQTHTVKKGDTLDKIAAKSSSSVPPPSAVVQPSAPAAASSTTFSQDVADRKAKLDAPITPSKPTFDIPPDPRDNLADITRLSGLGSGKTSTVPTAQASLPPALKPLDIAEPVTAQRSIAGPDLTKDVSAPVPKTFQLGRAAPNADGSAPEITVNTPSPSKVSPIALRTANNSADPIGTLDFTQGWSDGDDDTDVGAEVGPNKLTKENRKVSKFSFLRGL